MSGGEKAILGSRSMGIYAARRIITSKTPTIRTVFLISATHHRKLLATGGDGARC